MSRPARALVNQAPADAGHRPLPLDQSRLERFIGFNIARAELRLRRQFQCQIEGFELRPVEYAILVLVAANPGVSQKQVGDALEVSPPNFAIVIERLASRGLVRRSRGREDRRVQQLSLTPAGRSLTAAAETQIECHERELAQRLTTEERCLLFGALQKLW